MFELFKSNPFVGIAVIAVCDIFGLIGLIIYVFKHTAEKKRLKKILTAVICFAAADALLSFFIFSSNTFYDKNGNRYFSSDEVKYYDTDGTAYTLKNDEKERPYLVSENGTQMFSVKKIYIDKNGCIFYDRNNQLKQSGEHLFTDENGEKYYSFNDVKWDRNGHIKFIDNK